MMKTKHLLSTAGAGLALTLVPAVASADELSSGDTAWMLTATALVLFMTIPGLSLFYAGLVRSKNVLSVLMQCFAITGLMTILWAIYGYSLAATEGPLQGFIGGFGRLFLSGMNVDAMNGTIPESVFMTFQMTFAIITPALIVGAFAERMKFSAMLIFMALWLTFVYLPVWHWVWGGGWVANLGSLIGLVSEGSGDALDFAGGTVVHINAGVAALVAALMLGKRKGYPTTAMPPHNLGFTVIGASMLWVGWFGFNAGSAVAADGTAGMAMVVTQLATATAALTWMFAEWIEHGKPSVLGIATGAVAGLVAITPASGTAGPMGALAIGFLGSLFAYLASTKVKRWLGYDDSLDVWGVHGIAGIVGAILTGVFAAPVLGGAGLGEGVSGIGVQVLIQSISVIAVLVYGGLLSFIILAVIKATIGLRVSEEQETEGLDLALHDERGYII